MANDSRGKIKSDPAPDLKTEDKVFDQSRRSFAKAGAIVAPVMLSLANRPAWGGVTHRCNVSGWASVPVVGEGSGIPPSSDVCGFLSASDILGALTDEEKAAPISTIFKCDTSAEAFGGGNIGNNYPNASTSEGNNYPTTSSSEDASGATIGEALKGEVRDGGWTQYMVIAYYHEFPPVGLDPSGNPLGCSVEDVYCTFNSGASRYDFGNVKLTQSEVLEFLMLVIPSSLAMP